MADTPRVTVPVADLERVRDLLMERIYGSPARSPAHNARLEVEAMLSAAPAPEGGAVTADALLRWIEENPHNASWRATAKDIREIVTAPADRHERNLSMTNDELIEQALSHPPLEAPAHEFVQSFSTAREGGCKVCGRDEEAHREAPAEAGERECGWCDGRKTKQTPSTDFTIPCPYCKGTGREALRARPPAREDAQPVAWRAVWSDGTVYGEPKNWPPLDGVSTYHGLMSRTIQPLYIHPAPDALRVAVEALESIVDATDAENPDSYRADDREGCLDTVHAIATEALAALQALRAREESRSDFCPKCGGMHTRDRIDHGCGGPPIPSNPPSHMMRG